MKEIRISDMTLTVKKNQLSFKEKVEIARQLENLNVDAVEIPEIANVRSDTLFVRTVSAFVKNAVLSVCAGMTEEGVAAAAAALSSAAKPRIKVSLPVSVVCMEYECHLKPPKVLELIRRLVSAAKEKCPDVEFCAVDASRAESEFLSQAVTAAVESGATLVTLCDTSGDMLPDAFARFVRSVMDGIPSLENIPVGVACHDKNGMAAASAVLAAVAGASVIKTSAAGEFSSFETVAGIIKNCGDKNGICSNVKYTELSRGVRQISWIAGTGAAAPSSVSGTDASGIVLSPDSDPATVIDAVKMLGYDLSDEDNAKVYEEFCRVSEKKSVTSKELDAVVASVALQVPPTYKLVSYVINNGNIINASAQIKLLKNDKEELFAVGTGDGPVDAAFRTVEQIVGRHYELDDFQIQAVTEGREAIGSALVRLRSSGKLYSGNGVSTDIIGASIRAYINAINKIVYEEA